LYCHGGLVFLPQGIKGCDSLTHAAKDAKKRQKNISGAMDEALVKDELLTKNYRTKPFPL
jgi:hypothetical protein